MKRIYLLLRLVLSSLLIVALTMLVLPSARADAANLNHNYPRLANYFLKPTLSQSRADSLKKWDVLILDANFGYDSFSGLNSIRAQNPNVVLLPYIDTTLVKKRGTYDYDRRYNYLRLLAAETSGFPGWFLYDQYGNQVSNWTGTWNLNLSNVCPTHNGRQWADYLADLVRDEIIRDYPWDGVFYDDAHQYISWMNKGNLDLNNDGVKDDPGYLNDHWGSGFTTLFA
jgi:hypothetical protein